MQAPIKLREGDLSNFLTLQKAMADGNLALVSAVRISDGADVALVCAIGRGGDVVYPVPLAVMVEGDPFKLFHDPPAQHDPEDPDQVHMARAAAPPPPLPTEPELRSAALKHLADTAADTRACVGLAPAYRREMALLADELKARATVALNSAAAPPPPSDPGVRHRMLLLAADLISDHASNHEEHDGEGEPERAALEQEARELRAKAATLDQG